ncbi:hypothetical protein ACFE04_031771 [Oxalis oulophora]
MGSAQSVINFGALGDGKTDDSKAFLRAWEAICRGSTKNPTLVIPHGKTFLMNPVAFRGPCKPSVINFQIDGNIVASRNLGAFDVTRRERWISFYHVRGLHVYAKGQLDGNGDVWWAACPYLNPNCRRPTLLTFFGCSNLIVNGLRTINSPRNHISIHKVDSAVISNLYLSSPKTSTNTDGIDIEGSTNVRIEDSTIETGDDCIAINTGVNTLHITRVNCVSSHGISVGSLGKNGAFAKVEGIYVSHCNLTGSHNGVRIKSFPGGRGYAKNIWFTDIELHDSGNPIIIDQFYSLPLSIPNGSTDVEISDVHYVGIRGTSINDTSINLKCSKTVGCKDIHLTDINITPSINIPPKSRLTAQCINAHGKATRTSPAVTCLSP